MAYLVFKMTLKSSDSLISGYLYARAGNGDEIEKYNATSGQRRFQTLDHLNRKGKGSIPSCKEIGVHSFHVTTSPTKSDDECIAGDFYHITPDPMKIRGIKRSEFGIHYDANGSTKPGSAGCIVLTDKSEWKAFKQFMKGYKKEGFSIISLIVEYPDIN